MAMMQCPNCQSHIRKPTSPWAVIFGVVAFLSVGSLMLIFLCVAAIAVVGVNAAAEMEQNGTTMNIESFEDFGQQAALEQDDFAL